MCEYCNLRPNEWSDTLTTTKWTTASMTNLGEGGFAIFVSGDDDCFVKIEYCPFCGRYLE